MFTATVYDNTITAKHLAQLKAKASKIANKHHRAIDDMEVTTPWGAVVRFTRINIIKPWGMVEHGAWG